MENWKFPAICLQIALLLGSTSTISLAGTAVKLGDRNPRQRQFIIANTCDKCPSEEGGDICCPA